MASFTAVIHADTGRWSVSSICLAAETPEMRVIAAMSQIARDNPIVSADDASQEGTDGIAEIPPETIDADGGRPP